MLLAFAAQHLWAPEATAQVAPGKDHATHRFAEKWKAHLLRRRRIAIHSEGTTELRGIRPSQSKRKKDTQNVETADSPILAHHLPMNVAIAKHKASVQQHREIHQEQCGHQVVVGLPGPLLGWNLQQNRGAELVKGSTWSILKHQYCHARGEPKNQQGAEDGHHGANPKERSTGRSHRQSLDRSTTNHKRHHDHSERHIC
mmetsp:Transcript_18787/g.41335  ORF Transcript_18787/g.41335 Transcript_18787/m.41335 type:complete len:200 (-) Transcript_18787:150-749(-)